MSCELKESSSSSDSQDNQLELRAKSSYFDNSIRLHSHLNTCGRAHSATDYVITHMSNSFTRVPNVNRLWKFIKLDQIDNNGSVKIGFESGHYRVPSVAQINQKNREQINTQV